MPPTNAVQRSVPPLVEKSQVPAPTLLVDPVEALGGEGGAGRADRAEAAEVAPRPGLDAGLHAGGDVGGAGAEHRHAGPLGQLPERVHVWVAGVAVVEDDRGAGEQAGDEEVPHHPTGRREPEEAIAGVGVDVEVELLQVLEQDAALALDDRLGQAGGAGGVEDPERVVEGDALEAQLGALAGGQQLLPAHRAAQGGEVGLGIEVGEDDGVLEARHLRLEAGDRLAAVEVLAAVAVAVDGEEDPGLDLGEAVDDAGGAEVGRAAGPDRADARRGEEGDDRLGDVRHVGDDAVAALHAEAAQPRGEGGDLGAQLGPAQLGELAQLGGVQDRRLGVLLAGEDVLGVVEAGAGEPLRAGHLARCEDLRPVAVGPHVEEVPDRPPEPLEVVDRPAPELLVPVEPQPPLGLQPAHVLGQSRALDQLGRRLPELFGRPSGHSVAAAAPARACSRSSS